MNLLYGETGKALEKDQNPGPVSLPSLSATRLPGAGVGWGRGGPQVYVCVSLCALPGKRAATDPRSPRIAEAETRLNLRTPDLQLHTCVCVHTRGHGVCTRHMYMCLLQACASGGVSGYGCVFIGVCVDACAVLCLALPGRVCGLTRV